VAVLFDRLHNQFLTPRLLASSTFSNFPIILAILLDKLAKTPVRTVATLGTGTRPSDLKSPQKWLLGGTHTIRF
jgi:hypothetical protein